MKLTVDFTDLENAVRRMGAKPVDFNPHVEAKPLDRIGDELEGGKEVDIAEVDAKGGLLSYEGRQILLYIRDHGSKASKALINGREGNKFHVADCRTLQSMRARGRYERYVVTNRLDGLFPIVGKDWQTGEQVEGEAKLWVCQNCLKKLNYKGADSVGAYEHARDFDIGEFFSTYSSFFPHLPRRRADDKHDENYTQDWPQIAGQYKATRDFRCEECGVDLTARKNLLHVHHRNGVKSDNSPANLRALCISCHREQPSHGHMFVRHEDTRTINRLRREQRLLVEDSWEDAFKFCDPALHGVLDAVQGLGCSIPEIGFDVQDESHAIVASLEIAWPQEKMGIAISDADEDAASRAGWTLLDIEEVLDNPAWACEQLRFRHWNR